MIMRRSVSDTASARPWLLSSLLMLVAAPAFAVAIDVEVDQAVAAAREYSKENQREIVEELATLLAIPNVASDTANIRANADLIVSMLEQRGIDARLLEADGSPPAVYGEIDRGRRHTILVYAHYDGQPVQTELWDSDPWVPVMRSGTLEQEAQIIAFEDLPDNMPGEWRLFGRSASDDKAPIVGVLAAIDALQAADIPLSVNLKFFFEGEEEAGSSHLRDMISRHAELLQADFWLFCDGPTHQTRTQLISFGVRGVTGVDITLFGPARQLHSGHYGNWAPNPIMMLSNLLASMRSPDGEILIEGFADAVPAPSDEALAAIAAAPDVDAMLREELALGWTEGNGQRLERLLLNPAMNVRGISGGAVGADAKNAIADQATASIGFRLVPDLTPERVRELVDTHIEEQGYTIVSEPPDSDTLRGNERVALVEWSEHGYPAVWMDMADPRALAVSDVLSVARGGQLIRLPTMGGSLPLNVIRETLDVPIIILPIANHDNNQHSPNENLRLQNLWDAIEIYAAVFAAAEDALDARAEPAE